MSTPVTESRLTRRFAKLKEQNRAAFVTFITANDPNPSFFRQVLEGLPTAGADIIELGMPFSDPMADGPSIQLSSQRALKAGVSIDDLLERVAHAQDIGVGPGPADDLDVVGLALGVAADDVKLGLEVVHNVAGVVASLAYNRA